MLHSLNDLMQHKLRVADRTVRVDDAFFDPDERRLRYLAVDIGGWFAVDEVIVAADLLVPPATEGESWALRLDEQALAQAPRWEGERAAEPFDLTGWPPIIVGPFGGTYAPILMYEQMVASQRPGADGPPAGETGDALVWRMDRVTEWIGRPVFATDGEIGQVEDILIDDDGLRLSRLVLGSGGVFGHRTGEVAVDAVRHMARQGTHLVLGVSAAEAGAAKVTE
jgi:hypothetical protein